MCMSPKGLILVIRYIVCVKIFFLLHNLSQLTVYSFLSDIHSLARLKITSFIKLAIYFNFILSQTSLVILIEFTEKCYNAKLISFDSSYKFCYHTFI